MNFFGQKKVSSGALNWSDQSILLNQNTWLIDIVFDIKYQSREMLKYRKIPWFINITRTKDRGIQRAGTGSLRPCKKEQEIRDHLHTTGTKYLRKLNKSLPSKANRKVV